MKRNFIQGDHAAVVDEYLTNQSKIEPRLRAYRIILCESFYALRDYTRMEECTDQYVQLMPGKYEQSMHAMAFSLKALAHLDVGDYEKALEYADEALALRSRRIFYVQYGQWGMSHYRPFLNAYFVKAMVEAGLQSLFVTGTCLEYGMQSGPLSEDMVTLPSNPYGNAKDALRRQLEILKSAKPFALTWARLFYIYGEGQPKGSLYPQLKDAVLRGERVFNMSGGEQLRDYLPVEEVARLISILAERRYDEGCVNVCAGKPISVRNLVESWIEENDWPIRLNLGHYPYHDYEPMEFWGDRKKLDRLLKLQ